MIVRIVLGLSCGFGFFFFSSRRRHTRYWRDWSSDVCSSDLGAERLGAALDLVLGLDVAVDDVEVLGGEARDGLRTLVELRGDLGGREVAAAQIGRASCRERV